MHNLEVDFLMQWKVMLMALVFVCAVGAYEYKPTSGWKFVAETSKSIFEMKENSLDRTFQGSLFVLVRTISKNDGEIQRFKYHISTNDCQAGYGVVDAYKLNGVFITQFEFVRDDTAPLDVFADTVCKMGNY